VANDEEELWQSEALVSDSIGRLIEFWGFKRNMGRLWAILYLSDRPLSAPEIQDRLQLSSGAVSMTLSSRRSGSKASAATTTRPKATSGR
jgi:DNA-binding transcriptional regulator GbsR (MarR family)